MHGTTDGALLVLPSESPDELETLHQQGYPFVVIDPSLPVDDGIPVVAAANWAGARMATEPVEEPATRDVPQRRGLSPGRREQLPVRAERGGEDRGLSPQHVDGPPVGGPPQARRAVRAGRHDEPVVRAERGARHRAVGSCAGR